jgi:hypothetical protein
MQNKISVRHSFAVKTNNKTNESTIKIVDKSSGKPTHSCKQGRQEDAHCDNFITKDKSKIDYQFLLVHKVNKVNINIQYPSLFSQYFS